jgi:pimeloyl-ACP methyl ester carboxylesterase
MDRMQKLLVHGLGMLALAASTLAAQNPSPKPGTPTLTPGVIVPQQTCAAQPDQSYALYLPSHYATSRFWPIIYVFDPDGRGNIPVELMKDAAERYGYIVVGSNNSRNGAWKLEGDAAKAMWDDTHARLAIDDHRVYFAGFSGGARVAAVLAQRCKCAAGVLLDGAGFGGEPPSAENRFAVFAAVGTFDFNYPELTDLDEKLEQAQFPHILRHFDGPHDWAPAPVMDEALAWFRLIAMKENHEARDDSFIASQKSEALARVHALEQSGQPYEAWRECRQAVATFDGLADTAPLQQTAASLAQQPAVRDGAKGEKEEFQEQDEITRGIYAGLIGLRSKTTGGSDALQQSGQQPALSRSDGATGIPGGNALGPSQSTSDLFHDTEQKIVELRQRIASEKNSEKLRVERRALAGVFIGAAEFGDQSLDTKDFHAARQYYQLASDAKPDSAGALRELAKAMALDNDRKGSLKTLRRAKDASKDPTAFVAWLNQEPAFAKLHDEPQFRALLATP